MEEQRLLDDEREDQRRRQSTKETDFLRLKRSRLGVDDFESLKVIGRGAFGEVNRFLKFSHAIFKNFVIDCLVNP